MTLKKGVFPTQDDLESEQVERRSTLTKRMKLEALHPGVSLEDARQKAACD